MQFLTSYKKKWHYMVGISIFAFILSKINISQTMSLIFASKKPYFIASALLSIPVFFIRALRWRYLMLMQGINYGIKSTICMYFSSLYLGLVTPGRVGELAKVQYLRKDGHPLGKSLFSIFFDRISDGIVLIAFLILGLLAFQGIFRFSILVLYAVIIAFLALGIVFLLFYAQKNSITKILINSIKLMIPKRYKKFLKQPVNDFLNSIKIFNAHLVLITSLFTLTAALIYYAQAYLLTIALGFSINFFYLVFAVSLASLASLAPFSIFGIGTRDATLLAMFLYAGVSKELAIAFSILILANMLLLALFCLVFWLKNPVPFNTKYAQNK